MNNDKPQSVAPHYKCKMPIRTQVEMNYNSLDDRLPFDHPARKVVEFVDSIDTNACYHHIKSLHGGKGRPVTSPEILFSLWLYALIDGVNSARKICQHFRLRGVTALFPHASIHWRASVFVCVVLRGASAPVFDNHWT